MVKRTGIFFHYQDGERLRDFPEALAGILSRDNVFLYDAYYPLKPPSCYELEPIPEEVLLEVHSADMISSIKNTAAFMGALYSAAGTVAAAMRMGRQEIDNAFVFTGYGDHHAGSTFCGGGCYFNGAVMAIRQLRRHFATGRTAIVDTDAHHGDGTWELCRRDPETLYVCFCSGGSTNTNNNVNVRVPWRTSDEEYLNLVQQEFVPLAEQFHPEFMFWNWGYDGTQGDYGDIGISPETHVHLARLLKQTADRICDGRLIVVLCGGSRRDLARYLIPQIVSVLAGAE